MCRCGEVKKIGVFAARRRPLKNRMNALLCFEARRRRENFLELVLGFGMPEVWGGPVCNGRRARRRWKKKAVRGCEMGFWEWVGE